MKSSSKTKQLRIGGMTCVNCQNKIEKQLRNTAGVEKVTVSYNTGIAQVTYDTDMIALRELSEVIERLDYTVLPEQVTEKTDTDRLIGLVIIIAASYIFLVRFGLLNLLTPGQLADETMGYGMLFVIGLVTSVHCVAMCGGINLSQCIPHSNASKGNRFAALMPAFLYNLGRVISYTAIGFVVGGLGSVITFTTSMQGVLKLIAGVFMMIMGINMLGVFPGLRKFNPRMPKVIAQKVFKGNMHNKSPLIVGLLNGFMPCGPLQAMQIYALSTGNAFAGALSMFLFSVGTVPLMFSLGAVSSFIGKRFTSKVMTVGAVLVVVLGLSMLSQGFSLSGLSDVTFARTNSASDDGQNVSGIVIENGVQIINSTLTASRYPAITVEVGTPVKWIIEAPEGSINGCNNRFFIREYGIEYTFNDGENIIEFTPDSTGTFRYSCWMGMIRSTITVVDAGTLGDMPTSQSNEDLYTIETEVPSGPVPANVAIPTDTVAIAESVEDNDYAYHTVTINLTDEGFSPAIVVVQAGVETEWIINNTSSRDENFELLVPIYYTEICLSLNDTPIYFMPDSSFDFSNKDGTSFGYVKMVEDISAIDLEAIKQEVENFETMIWPLERFGSRVGGEDSCH